MRWNRSVATNKRAPAAQSIGRSLTQKNRLAYLRATACEFGHIWISSGIGTNLLDVRSWHITSIPGLTEGAAIEG
jgi:hypothetical protein